MIPELYIITRGPVSPNGRTIHDHEANHEGLPVAVVGEKEEAWALIRVFMTRDREREVIYDYGVHGPIALPVEAVSWTR